MGIFSKPKKASLPPECEGLEIRTEASICTGEKTIGFYDPVSKKLLYRELVRSEEDIRSFYEKYGREYR